MRFIKTRNNLYNFRVEAYWDIIKVIKNTSRHGIAEERVNGVLIEAADVTLKIRT